MSRPLLPGLAGSVAPAAALVALTLSTPASAAPPSVQLMGATRAAQDSTPPAPAAPPPEAPAEPPGPGGTPAAPSGGPTVELGPAGGVVAGSGPIAVADKPVEEPTPKKEKTLVDRFAGSAFFTQTSASLQTLFPNLQQSKNPTVEQFSILSPRFAISDDWQLRGRFSASYEFTSSDDSTYRNEFLLGDTSLQLFYRGIPAFWQGTKLNLIAQAVLPTSKASQARSMYVSPGAGFQLSHPFEHVLGGEVLLIGSATYSHPLYRYTTAGLANAPAYNPACVGADGSCVMQASGTANPSDNFAWVLIASGEWGKWSPGALLWVTYSVPYGFKDIAGVSRLEDRTQLRMTTYVAAWLDYHLTDWLTPEVGYQFQRNVLDGDGKYGNPLFGQYQDARVYLGFNVQLDSFYKFLRGDKGDAGVVRATNERRPALAF